MQSSIFDTQISNSICSSFPKLSFLTTQYQSYLSLSLSFPLLDYFQISAVSKRPKSSKFLSFPLAFAVVLSLEGSSLIPRDEEKASPNVVTPKELLFEVFAGGRDEKLSPKELVLNEFELVPVAVLEFCDEKALLKDVALNELLELVPMAVFVFCDDDEVKASPNVPECPPNAFPPIALPEFVPNVLLDVAPNPLFDELFEVALAHGSVGILLVTAGAGVVVVAQGFANDEEMF